MNQKRDTWVREERGTIAQEQERGMAEGFCALCGEPILKRPDDPARVHSDEHVVAKQFYPEPIRRELRSQLWTVPSHQKCNNDIKPDEEYFFHRYYPLVSVKNPAMGRVLLDDLKRRAEKPQTPVMLRHMLNEC